MNTFNVALNSEMINNTDSQFLDITAAFKRFFASYFSIPYPSNFCPPTFFFFCPNQLMNTTKV